MIPKELKEKCNTVYDWLELICDISIDYDGYTDSNDLMNLIDEMREYANEAIKCINTGDI